MSRVAGVEGVHHPMFYTRFGEDLEQMSENHSVKKYERKATPIERLFTRSPYSIVTMVARIRGNATENILRSAVSQVRQRHPNLRVRITEDDNGDAWFTSVGAKEIPVEIAPRESDDLWIKVVQESCQSGEYREHVKYGRE
jgi:hypothetical protein